VRLIFTLLTQSLTTDPAGTYGSFLGTWIIAIGKTGGMQTMRTVAYTTLHGLIVHIVWIHAHEDNYVGD